jgi:hypothetical protein
MPIKDISAPVATAKKSKTEMPSVTLTASVSIVDDKGERTAQLLTEFNKARAAYKLAESQMKELEPSVKEAGVREWIKVNSANAPGEPITSIKLVDLNGSETRLTGMDKYPIADPEPVEALFDDVLKADANDFVQFTLKASFDSKVFLNKNGNFDQRIYDAFKVAIDATAKKLGVASPLSTVKVLSPKPDFHKSRWEKFNVVQQSQIFKVLPNTITLTPLTTNEPVPAPATATPDVA